MTNRSGIAGLQISRLLAVTDRDDAHLLHAADDLARQHDAQLDILCPVPKPTDLGALARATYLDEDELLHRIQEDRVRAMSAFVEQCLPDREVKVHVALGTEFIEIIRFATAHNIDLVVKIAEKLSGIQGRIFASTDQHLLRKCPVPIWLRTPSAAQRPLTVVAAVDVDYWDAREPETLANLNKRVIDAALSLPSGTDSTVHVLHAWDAIGEGMIWTFSQKGSARLAAEAYVNEVEDTRRRALDALLQPFLTRDTLSQPRIVPRLGRGSARDVIPDVAKEVAADVVVMGTVARTGISGVIIGNTAEDILNAAGCSIMAVKPSGFVCPIEFD